MFGFSIFNFPFMKIAVVGTGYVGLVSGTCFSDMGIDVTCVDIDRKKIEGLNNGVIPIYEPGLEEMVISNLEAGRLHFTTSLAEHIDDYEVIFCAVGTPPDEDGSADLRYVLEVAREVGRNINKYTVFVTKSTVPVGTGAKAREAIAQELEKRGIDICFDVASNPEFLAEGVAVKDFMNPDRIVVGVASARAREVMERLYKPFILNRHTMIFTDIPSAEMIKYASNSMLATRISFMNDIANVCELLGANIDLVREGMGSDSRIGSKFLYPGVGYGGSCFPKDVKALINMADSAGYEMRVLKAVEEVNDTQKRLLFRKFNEYYGGAVAGRTVTVWGLSFKPETDDMREAPSLVLIGLLLEAGCRVRVYDPIAMGEARRRLGDAVHYSEDKYGALEGADALMIVTEWKEFRVPDFGLMKANMSVPVIFDGRNIYGRDEMKEKGFDYYSIG